MSGKGGFAPRTDKAGGQYRKPGDGSRAARPKDAATLVLVRRDRKEPEVLMGKRSAGHAFMPNKFVFPGGRIDRADYAIAPMTDFTPVTAQRVTYLTPEAKARALAMAALRETYEEVGMLVGARGEPLRPTRSPAWKPILDAGVVPRLDILHMIARAVTPPYRTKRFDARFFMADAEHIQAEVQGVADASGELLEVHWVPLSEARALDLPQITRMVLEELGLRLGDRDPSERPVPFVRFAKGKAVQDLL